LVSCCWRNNKIAVVAHSFRVMSKARNYDEMIVGLMHHIYEYSRHAKGLYNCDVNCGYLWRDTLDLLSGNGKNKKDAEYDEEVLMDYGAWSSEYKKKKYRIATDRTARNVMIYDLEDTLDLLLHPEKKSAEEAIDNGIFMRELTDSERNGMIQKYYRSLDILKRFETNESRLDDFSEEKYAHISKLCIDWYEEWLISELGDREYEKMYNDEGANQ